MLDLFTVIWGPMVESLTELTLPSLLQPKNIPQAGELLGTYTFYASDQAREHVRSSEVGQRLETLMRVLWLPLHRGEGEVTSNIVHQMCQAIERGSYLLVMSPDWALGNGSLYNMARLCQEGCYNPILYGFPRVNEAGYIRLKERFREAEPVSNRELVSLALKHMEQVTYFMGQAMTNNWVICNNMWLVGHNVPTPCLKPDEKMLQIFETNPTLNSGYDHSLPYLMVEQGYPWHFIGNSDIYFQVERGRHLIGEQVFDRERWQTKTALKALRFFDGQRQLWQGE